MNIRILILRFLVLPAVLSSLVGCGLINRTAGTAMGAASRAMGAAQRTAGMATRTAGAAASSALRMVPTKLLFSCLPEGTPIDTPDGPQPIESIRPGDEVIGFQGNPVRVLQKHGYDEDATAERFLRVKFENGAQVRLCDMHRIDGVRSKNLKPDDRIGSQVVKSIEVFGGVERSYDLLTEDAGYRISGLPVNSMIEEMAEASRRGLESVRAE